MKDRCDETEGKDFTTVKFVLYIYLSMENPNPKTNRIKNL